MAVPAYLLIAADLRSKIEAGKMRPGAQLPPEKNLQDEYGKLSGVVSRNTVRSAIEMLVREGLLEKRRGQGTFIVGKLDSLPSFTSPAGPDPASSMQMHLNFDVDDLDAHPCLQPHLVRSFARICDNAGTRKIRVHALRHTTLPCSKTLAYQHVMRR